MTDLSNYPNAILVTGGLGFIGGHTVELLCQTFPNTKIVVLDKKTYAVMPDTLTTLNKLNIEIVYGDICNSQLMIYLIKRYNFDFVLHMAAETHVDKSFGNSMIFSQTNILGTHTLLETLQFYCPANFKCLIHVSTDEVHGTTSLHEQSCERVEDAVLNPTNPYAATKAGAEFLVNSYHQIPSIITRGNNVYGPRQHPEKLIPRTIHRLIAGEPAQIHGTGSQKRSFVYVKDVAQAFALLIKHYQDFIGQRVLIGSAQERTVTEITKTLGKLIVPELPIEYVADPRIFNDQRYISGVSQSLLSYWRPDSSENQWLANLQDTIDYERTQHQQRKKLI